MIDTLLRSYTKEVLCW